eukprot:Clim_evm76s210 gene=Clim_evmTU76s210
MGQRGSTATSRRDGSPTNRGSGSSNLLRVSKYDENTGRFLFNSLRRLERRLKHHVSAFFVNFQGDGHILAGTYNADDDTSGFWHNNIPVLEALRHTDSASPELLAEQIRAHFATEGHGHFLVLPLMNMATLEAEAMYFIARTDRKAFTDDQECAAMDVLTSVGEKLESISSTRNSHMQNLRLSGSEANSPTLVKRASSAQRQSISDIKLEEFSDLVTELEDSVSAFLTVELTKEGPLMASIDPAAAKILGYRSTAQLEKVPVHIFAPEWEQLLPTPEDGNTVSLTMKIRCGDGFFRRCDLKSTRVKLSGTEILNIQICGTPAHEKTREQLTNLIQTAQTFCETKGILMSVLSHELRTPLGRLSQSLDLIKRTSSHSTGGEISESLGIMDECSSEMLRTVDSFFDYLELENGKAYIARGWFNLSDLADDIIKAHKQSAESKNISIVCANELHGNQFLFSDARKIRYVIMELLENSIKFSPEHSEIRVTLKYERDANTSKAGSGTVAIEVVDCGVGMDESALKTCFSPLHQADMSITRAQGGLGMGLALCRSSIDALGGSITAESELGEGSAFYVNLPVGPDEVRRALDGSTQAVTSSSLSMIGSSVDSFSSAEDDPLSEEENVSKISQSNILVVDDNRINVTLLHRLLRQIGYQSIDSATNGLEAFEMSRVHDYDIIFMDIMMPLMDGLAATRNIISECTETGRRPPTIIAVSADITAGIEQRCANAGATAYVRKPLGINQLHNIMSALTNKRVEDALDTSRFQPSSLQSSARMPHNNPILLGQRS